MANWTRRDFLKSGVVASAGAASLGSRVENLLAAQDSPSSGEAGHPDPANSLRKRLLLDFGWRFHLGNSADPAKDFDYGLGRAYQKTGDFFKPSHPDFDDSDWEAINLPHDWAVALPFVHDHWLTDHGSKPLGRQYPATSIGWYRRVFRIPESDRGKRLSLEFDGVFRDSMAALNGNFLGRNMSGYAPFTYDITDQAFYGRKNVLVVRVDATEHEGWWYEGAGIYRHVWLVKTNPVHVPQWGTFVTYDVYPNSAMLTIATEVSNDQHNEATCSVTSNILDSSGNVVGTQQSLEESIKGWRRRKFTQDVQINNPRLWSIEEPNMYRLVTTVKANGTTTDRYDTPFGIRTIRFDKDQGFFLNGKPVKIKGTCNHQDHAGVGIALPDRLQYYRIARLKEELGANGLRTSHNPPTPELMDACDRLGMVVLDETRMFSSVPQGLSQLSRLIRRDRNHPAVVFWSTGNEEPEQGSPRGARMCRTMKRLVHRLDPTRPITQAMNGDWGKGISAVLDIQGFNYHLAPAIDAFHREFPEKPCVGTEVASTVSTRGIYFNNPEKGYVSAYDVNHPPWATTAEVWWQIYDARPFLSGGFVWTGFDYRGEPTPYGWPCISSHFGVLDTCGFPKDLAFYYKAWWGDKPLLHLFPHWNWAGKEGQKIDVWCFSNLDRIELFLNGNHVGTQIMQKNSHVAWEVKYEPGTLLALGYKGSQQVMSAVRETTGAPARILLRPDRSKIRADGEDVSVVAVSVADSKGRVVPIADNLITFEVTGNGKVIGVGNGDPSSHEADKASERKAFNGLCVAIVQASKQAGQITVQATSPGLESATATIDAEQATPRPAVA